MKTISILFILLSTLTMQAQNAVFKTLPDPKAEGSNMLVGQITINDIRKDGTCAWFDKGFTAYKPDSTIIKTLQLRIKDYTITLMVGTWCEDTQLLLPQFYKTMDACNYPIAKIEMLGTDRQKHALNIEHLLLRVEHVPTIIINKGPREIGRIVETISSPSIEAELLQMIEHDIETWK
jgi:hypothetical protein